MRMNQSNLFEPEALFEPEPQSRRQAPRRAAPAGRRRRRSGFTLIEAAMVTVIIGVGVMGTLQLLAAGTVANLDASELTTAMHLAGNIREMTMDMRFKEAKDSTTWGPETGETLTGTSKYDDIDDLDGWSSGTAPINVRRGYLTNFTGWKQTVEVHSVDEDLLTAKAGKDNVMFPVSRVIVRVSHHGQQVYETSWLVVNTMN